MRWGNHVLAENDYNISSYVFILFRLNYTSFKSFGHTVLRSHRHGFHADIFVYLYFYLKIRYQLYCLLLKNMYSSIRIYFEKNNTNIDDSRKLAPSIYFIFFMGKSWQCMYKVDLHV